MGGGNSLRTVAQSGRSLCLVFVLHGLIMSWSAQAEVVSEQWSVISQAFFPGRDPALTADFIRLQLPVQAENPAIVPLQLDVDSVQPMHKLYLFVDGNPITHTLTVQFPEPRQRFTLATRIRLEKSSMVRVLAESGDGNLYMQAVPVKTPGGGCGGAISQDETKLRASAGQMKAQRQHGLNQSDQTASFEELTLHIRHPMRTGFERTSYGYYAKAWYLQQIDFKQAQQPLLHLDLGPGISADPYFKLTLPDTQSTISVMATDNEHQRFSLELMSH